MDLNEIKFLYFVRDPSKKIKTLQSERIYIQTLYPTKELFLEKYKESRLIVKSQQSNF